MFEEYPGFAHSWYIYSIYTRVCVYIHTENPSLLVPGSVNRAAPQGKGEIDWQRARNGVCSEHLVVL